MTGHPLFESASVAKIIADQAYAAPKPLSERVERKIPAELERVVLRCLEKKPEDRPQSAEELSDMLGSCETEAEWTREKAQEW